jgi:hypothetical protein
VANVLKIREEQLELSIKLGEWSDAHRTAANIYKLYRLPLLDEKKGLSKCKIFTNEQLQDLYVKFFGNLSRIFWESELYLFHAYSLQNIQYRVKSLKASNHKQKRASNDKFVLAALSVPFNTKLNNFEKISFNY